MRHSAGVDQHGFFIKTAPWQLHQRIGHPTVREPHLELGGKRVSQLPGCVEIDALEGYSLDIEANGQQE
jgi:hypothetical protein